MENVRRWFGYDWFKLIVALALLILLVVLFVQQRPISGVASQAATSTPTSIPVASVIPSATISAPTSVAEPSATQTPSPTQTAAPAQVPTATPPVEQPTSAPPPTTEQPTPTATTEAAQTASGDCSGAAPTRLKVGMKAVVAYNLNLRKAAGMDQEIVATHLPTTLLDILGGPVCIPYDTGVYRWWNVKTADGAVGWSAESALNTNTYFMEPAP